VDLQQSLALIRKPRRVTWTQSKWRITSISSRPKRTKPSPNSTRDISGFRLRHQSLAAPIKPWDSFVCYVTRLSRWIGLLDVIEGPFIDHAPIFVPEDDPFVVRFKVKPVTWLNLENGIPIHDKAIWRALSFTRELERGSLAWTGKVRGSLVRLDDPDGAFLAEKLRVQVERPRTYPLDDQDKRKLTTHTVVRCDKVVSVSVPEKTATVEESTPIAEFEGRESISIQALIAGIDAQMGMSIWIPRTDRTAVLREWRNEGTNVLDRLPLNYDDGRPSGSPTQHEYQASHRRPGS
jgi:hypothetical protein